MRYFGGKSKTAKDIVEILNKYRISNQEFHEPFVGGANIISKITGDRYGYDINEPLIELYKSLQNGYIPPSNVSKIEYDDIKNDRSKYPLELVGFIGFACSFAGKYFGGYASCKRGDNYALNGKNSILKKAKLLSNVKFKCADYRTLEFDNCLIYCDPPYNNTTGYSSGKFDSIEFWNIVRTWSKNNIVIISEYNAPEDFDCIWSKNVKTEIRTKINGREDRIEKLFKLKEPII